ncbi:MAG: SDR family oxidoreductase [Balneolaceae bacterium]|nr:SDR family oxidoreductase [Balneolaceae bacterium]
MSRLSSPFTAVVTGASRGIGRRIARALAREGDVYLLLVARSREGLVRTRSRCMEEGAPGAELQCCDLTEPEQVQALEVPDTWPPVGLLVNNAGSYLLKDLQATTYEEYHRQIQSNLFSAVHATGRFLPGMKEQGQGLLVNICSVGALQGLAESGAYASSKHALLGFTRSLREELKEEGIGVTAVNLGQTHSSSWKDSDRDPRELVDPEDVARIVVALARLSGRSVVEELRVQPQGGQGPPL